MITLDDQLFGMKLLDKAYELYQRKGFVLMYDKMYEYGFQYLKETVGMAKLTEIAMQTNGTKENVRVAHIKYLFDNIFENIKNS